MRPEPEFDWYDRLRLTFRLGMNAAYAPFTEASALRIWPRDWTVDGELRCASATASASEIGCAVVSAGVWAASATGSASIMHNTFISSSSPRVPGGRPPRGRSVETAVVDRG